MRLQKWIYTVPLRLRSLFRKAEVESELSEELEDHLDRKARELIATGSAPNEARRTAMREFGGLEQSKERCRDARRVNFLEDVIQDVRHGVRVLRKNLGFAVVAVLTLALGIGANTAIFSVVNTVMLRPLPYPDADRLVLLNETAENRGRLEMMSVSWPDYLDWRQQARSFQYLGIFRGQNLTLTGFDQAERLNGAMASSDIFAAMGIHPLLGRTFIDRKSVV